MKVFITGSSHGIGEALAKWYLKEEAELFGLGRSDLSVSYHYRSVDISDFEALKERLESLLYGVAHLDLVVLNAGIFGGIEDISLCSIKQLQHEMDVNMWANKVILDFLIEKGIRSNQIIAMSSGASISGSLGWNGYALSKAALNMLIKLYAAEMHDTHLSSLAPGLIRTQMLQGILLGDQDSQRYGSIERLRRSEEEGLIESPDKAAEKIVMYLPKLLEYQSGSYIDLREI